MEVTAYSLAQRYIGVHEIPGELSHPLIQWWLSLCGYELNSRDEIAWCSAFCQGPTWELRLPRSKSARARSWLKVGTPIELRNALPEFDVVVLKRGTEDGPTVIDAPGHVGFFAGLERGGGDVILLGGNQKNEVCLQAFPVERVIGVRRLA